MHKKRFLVWTMIAALLLSMIPFSKQAQAAAPNFFIPDNGVLANTANMVINPAPPAVTPLNRNSAYVTNSQILSISGLFQQVTSSSINLTVDQMSNISGTWQPEPGKTATSSVTTSGGNRFTASSIELYPGFNRITFSGKQGSVTKTDVFYVVYDSAPLLNSLTITSGSQTYNLNEGASLVLTSSSANIQGSATNVKDILFNGQKASVLSNGMFFAPAVTLTPGLNTFDIVLSNGSDSIAVKRQVYYYVAANPFSIVDVKQTGSTTAEHLLGKVPTLTGTTNTATLDLEFLIPYQNTAVDNTSTQILINTVDIDIAGTASETVITNTYGQPSYKLVKLTTNPYTLAPDAAQPPYNLAQSQPVDISITYTGATLPSVTLNGSFTFNMAAGQILVENVYLLPNYDGTSDVVASTVKTPLDGAEVTAPDFYVLVDTSQDLLVADTLQAALQPLGTAALTVTRITAPNTYATDLEIFQIQGLPQGLQTLAFSVNSQPASFTADVSYVAKNYVSVDNLYDGQIFTKDSNVTNSIPLSGKLIGFGTRLLNKQLLINNVDMTAALLNLTAMNADGSYDFPLTLPNNMTVDRLTGPLFYGENNIKFIVDYSDGTAGTPGVLRQYVKEIKFYIIDSNVPDIATLRPLTPPTAPTVRGNLNSTDPNTYLPASPELQNKQTYYATTLSKIDLFVQGSGAARVVVKDGGTIIYDAAVSATTQSAPASVATSVNTTDYYGSKSSFRIRIDDYPLTVVGTKVFAIELTNDNGAVATQTVEVRRDNVPYRLLSPVSNTNGKIVVNKNFVLFDVEAQGATEVLINGQSATPRTDIPDRYMYTLTGLKGDSDNKIALVVKRASGEIKDTVTVNYVTDPDVGAMYMEQMNAKHSVFNKTLELTFPKNTILRREEDGKVQPKANLLFGIADPETGNTELVNDYGQVLGVDRDGRTTNGSSVISIGGQLSGLFSNQFGREQFTPVSPYYWISAGIGEAPSPMAYAQATGGLAPYSKDGNFTKYDERRVVVPSERGTLSLKFNDSLVEQIGPEISVFFLGNEGDWKNIGGEVNMRDHTVTVPFDEFGYYMVGKLKYGFNDITNHGWARNILQALYSKGFMPKLYFNNFGTDDYITRGEFAALLVRSLGIKQNVDDNHSFLDIIPGSRSVTWNYAEIETAARTGIVQGFENRVFAPDLLITRQDAAVMIARAQSLKMPNNDAKLAAKLLKAFADAPNISYYAQPSVDVLNSAGIMVGSPVDSAAPSTGKPLLNFNPTANMTRAEAGQVAVRLLQKYTKIFPKNLS